MKINIKVDIKMKTIVFNTAGPRHNEGFGGQIQYLRYKLPTLYVELTFI